MKHTIVYFVNDLRKVRKAKGYTQEELARASMISQNTISDIERGKQTPSMFHALWIARTLDVHITNLFRLEEREVE